MTTNKARLLFHAASGGAAPANPYLVYHVGNWQLFDPGSDTILTFVQGYAAAFSNARPNGGAVNATGPGAQRKNVNVTPIKLTNPAWAERDTVGIDHGQSTAAAAPVGAPLDDEGLSEPGASHLTRLAPLADKLVCLKNGPNSSAVGPSAPASRYVWQDDDFMGPLEDVRAFINPTINRELPGISAGLMWANALPEGGRHFIISPFAGSASLGEVTGATATVTSAGYDAETGRTTYVTPTTHRMKLGEVFGAELNELTGLSPEGYNTGGVVVDLPLDEDGINRRIVVEMDDPGAATATGTGEWMDWGIQAKNCFRALAYWRDNHVRPGKTPWLAYDILNGHESASNALTIAAGLEFRSIVRRFTAHCQNIVNPDQDEDAFIIHSQNNAPAFDRDVPTARIGQCSISCCAMQDYICDHPEIDDRYLSFPMFSLPSGSPDFNPLSPHFGITANPALGSMAGCIAVEAWNGTYQHAPRLSDDFTLIIEDPTKIVGTTTRPIEFDYVEVADPNGQGGFQVFNMDIGTPSATAKFSDNVPDFSGGALVETAGTVAIDDVDLEFTADWDVSKPLFVGAGWQLDRAITDRAINSSIIAASWDPETLQGVIDFNKDIGIDLRERINIYQANGAGNNEGWNNLTPGWLIEEGSTSTRLVTTIPTDPGLWVSGGRTVRNATYSVGAYWGNVHCAVAATEEANRYNIMTGEKLRERMLVPKPRQVFIRSNNKFLVEQRAAYGALNADWLTHVDRIWDFADARTWSASGAAAEALGNTADDLTVMTNFVMTGTANSGSRDTFAEANAANAWMATPQGSTLLRDAHKRGAHLRLVLAFRYKSGANNQYPISTCFGEGAGSGAGFCLRTNSAGVPTFLVRNDSGGTVFQAVMSAAAFTDGVDYLVEIDIKDSDDGVAPGWGWIKINGVIRYENAITFSSPSTATSQSRLCFGVNGVGNATDTPAASTVRRLALGWRYYFAQTGSDTTIGGPTDTPYWDPIANSLAWRQAGNSF